MIRVACFLLLVTLTGCSISGTYYLRNITELPATLTIVLDESIVSNSGETIDLMYDNRIHKIKFGTYKKFKKRLSGQVIDSYRVSFTIPPKSTVFIGRGLNTGFWGGFQQAIIKVGEAEKSLDTNSQEQMQLSMNGLMKYTGYYDISL